MRPAEPWRLSAALLVAALAAASAAVAAGRDDGRVRGITISTHTDGRDWGGPGIAPTMREIADLGATWVAIHPYAGIGGDGEVRFPTIDPAAPPEWLTRPIREAHAAGLKIAIKPHLAYWGSPFAWRGEIRFDDEASWRRFWDGYRRFTVALAAATRDADGFVIGTELDGTIDREADWRRLISAIRAATDAPLTYAANWTDFERVPFWDAVDVAGIQAYFPLVEEGQPADRASIRTGWERLMGRLRRFSTQVGRPVVFTELGYSHGEQAPYKPWVPEREGEAGRRMQALCLAEALRAIEREPAVIGAFLWKWFPEPHPVGRDFQLATPAIRQVIREAWRPSSPPLSTAK